MRVWLKRAVLIGLAALAVAQFIQPSKDNPPIDPARSIDAAPFHQPEVAAIFERACNDCHSHKTVWPWYGKVAPISWYLSYDVKKGRSELNFSEWSAYTPQQSQKLLREICEEVSEGKMPGKAYTLAHPSSALTDADIQTLCAWTKVAQQ